jgi:hypothetical protein
MNLPIMIVSPLQVLLRGFANAMPEVERLAQGKW